MGVGKWGEGRGGSRWLLPKLRVAKSPLAGELHYLIRSSETGKTRTAHCTLNLHYILYTKLTLHIVQ